MTTARHHLNDQILILTQEWLTFRDSIDAKRREFNIGRKRQYNEKSSKYFFCKYNAVPGSTKRMYEKHDNLQTEDKAILNICSEFYNDLYNKDIPGGDSPYTFIPERDQAYVLLNENEIKSLQEEVTLDELTAAIKSMSKGKAPGLDGLSVDFYQEFWEDVGLLVLNSLLTSKQKGKLTPDQHRDVVKLIPKKRKNPCFVRNLRPITLLNVDVKILTKALASKMKDILDRIVSSDQHVKTADVFLPTTILRFKLH